MTRWAAGPAAAAIVLAAACGSAGSSTSTPSTAAASRPPSPSVLTGKVRTALQNAKSVHVNGMVNQDARKVSLNVSLTHAGGVSGQLAINGAQFGILSSAGHTYIKLTSGFVKYTHLPPSVCSLMCGKYLKTSADQSRSMVGGLTMSSLFGKVSSASPDYTYAGTATVNGQPAWILHGRTGGTAYVAAHGQPYPLRFTAPAAQGGGHLDFTQWNTATIPPPPPASKVVDLNQLHG